MIAMRCFATTDPNVLAAHIKKILELKREAIIHSIGREAFDQTMVTLAKLREQLPDQGADYIFYFRPGEMVVNQVTIKDLRSFYLQESNIASLNFEAVVHDPNPNPDSNRAFVQLIISFYNSPEDHTGALTR